MLNYEYIESRASELIQYFNSNQEINVIHYATFDELLADALFLTGEKQNFDNQLHAFVSFWKKDYSFFENILIDKELTNRDIEFIFTSFMSEVKEFEFRQISDLEFYKEINIILPAIKKAILDNHAKMQETVDINEWGIFLNNKRINDVENYILPIEGTITNACFLSSVWNNIKIFAETSSQYLYFSWGTGA